MPSRRQEPWAPAAAAALPAGLVTPSAWHSASPRSHPAPRGLPSPRCCPHPQHRHPIAPLSAALPDRSLFSLPGEKNSRRGQRIGCVETKPSMTLNTASPPPPPALQPGQMEIFKRFKAARRVIQNKSRVCFGLWQSCRRRLASPAGCAGQGLTLSLPFCQGGNVFIPNLAHPSRRGPAPVSRGARAALGARGLPAAPVPVTTSVRAVLTFGLENLPLVGLSLLSLALGLRSVGEV